MKIGIDIDTIRNINPRVIKYYIDNINKDFVLKDGFTEEDIDIDKELKFKNKNEKKQFFHEDYPYEIYGCSNPYNANLPVELNAWMKNMENIDLDDIKVNKGIFYKLFHKKRDISNNEIKIGLFGIMSSELIIGSTLFFLSKIGCRCRNIMFPLHSEDVYDTYDVIITSNPKILKEKVSNKIVILINHKYNRNYKRKCEFNYDSLNDFFKDKKIINKLKNKL